MTEETYFLLIFGVGLGGHIDPLVERTNCHVLILVEPNLEFIYHSLEVYDWAALFERFEERNGRIEILVDSNPDGLAREIRDTVCNTNPCSLDGMYVFTHYNNSVFVQTSEFVLRDPNIMLFGLGWVDDEIMMIKNAHASLYPGTAQVYLRPTASPVGLPAFVVGSGPSLDRDIPFLKKNADKAIILSCGSAIRPLLVNDIVPDFQIEVENLDVYRQIEQVARSARHFGCDAAVFGDLRTRRSRIIRQHRLLHAGFTQPVPDLASERRANPQALQPNREQCGTIVRAGDRQRRDLLVRRRYGIDGYGSGGPSLQGRLLLHRRCRHQYMLRGGYHSHHSGAG